MLFILIQKRARSKRTLKLTSKFTWTLSYDTQNITTITEFDIYIKYSYTYTHTQNEEHF